MNCQEFTFEPYDFLVTCWAETPSQPKAPGQLDSCSGQPPLLSLKNFFKYMESGSHILIQYNMHYFFINLYDSMNYYILIVTSILLRKIWELRFGFPWWLSGKETACNAGVGLTSGWGRSPGKGSGNPFQYSLFYLFITFYLFIFGCSGSSLLCSNFL